MIEYTKVVERPSDGSRLKKLVSGRLHRSSFVRAAEETANNTSTWESKLKNITICIPYLTINGEHNDVDRSDVSKMPRVNVIFVSKIVLLAYKSFIREQNVLLTNISSCSRIKRFIR